MIMYGPTLLVVKVASEEDLKDLIRCLPELPDPSTVSEDTVVQLTQSQPGYIATHFYRLESGRWQDVTEGFGPTSITLDDSVQVSPNDVWARMNPSQSDDQFIHVPISWTVNSTKRTNFLNTVTPIAGKLVKAVMVRKRGSKPTNPNDGEAVFVVSGSDSAGQFTSGSHTYKFYDRTHGTSAEQSYSSPNSLYHYSMFEIFESGWWVKTK